jgi:hypothetical protein
MVPNLGIDFTAPLIKSPNRKNSSHLKTIIFMVTIQANLLTILNPDPVGRGQLAAALTDVRIKTPPAIKKQMLKN